MGRSRSTHLPPAMTLDPGRGVLLRVRQRRERRISLHLLGYLFDPSDATSFRAERARLRDRPPRACAQRMVETMAADGLPISWEQVSALAGPGAVGRPHLARALVDSGVVPDIDSAFRDVLSSRAGYYVRKADIDVFAAIAMIRNAGGLPVFAHPLARRRGPVVPDDEVVAQMAAAGLVGMEVDHPDQDDRDRAEACRCPGPGSRARRHRFVRLPRCQQVDRARHRHHVVRRVGGPAGAAHRMPPDRQALVTSEQGRQRLFMLHPVAARGVRLPAPLPLHLPRPADAAQGAALGAQQPRCHRARPRWRAGSPNWFRRTAPLRPARSSSRDRGYATGSVMRSSPTAGGDRAAAGYATTSQTSTRSENRLASSAPWQRPRRPWRSADGWTGSTSVGEELGDRRLQDRARASRRRTTLGARRRWRSTCSARVARCAGRAARVEAPSPAERQRGRIRPHRRISGPPPRTGPRQTAHGHRHRHRHARVRRGPSTPVFPPAPSALCSWCDFRSVCPEGQAAAPAIEPWAGVARGLG